MRFKFLHGLDDDMREQALKDFWHENKHIIIGGFAILFLSYGAGQGYRHYKAHQTEANALGYHQASQLDTPAAYKDFAQAAPSGFEGLALFKAAQAHVAAENPEAAADVFAQIRETGGLPTLWRDLAAIRQAELLLTLNPEQAQGILAELVGDESPYQRTAYELLAIEAQNREAYDEAAAYYERLLDMPDLPAGMAEGIEQRLSYLEGKGYITETGQQPRGQDASARQTTEGTN